MKNFLQRYLTAAILVPILFWLIKYGPTSVFIAVITGAFLVSLNEWLTLLKKCDLEIPRVFCLLLALINVLFFIIRYYKDAPVLIFFSIFLNLFGLALYEIIIKETDMRKLSLSAGTGFFAVTITSWAAGSLILLRFTKSNPDGRFILFFLLAVVWIGDTGAMHMGKLFGKHKLCPVISPKKSVEGLVGAIIFGFLAGGVAYHLCGFHFPKWQLIILTTSLVLLAHTGDLTASIVKRSCNVKDSGSLLPGHGGFMDRLDNLLLSAPFMYLFTELFWIN